MFEWCRLLTYSVQTSKMLLALPEAVEYEAAPEIQGLVRVMRVYKEALTS